VPGRAKPTFQGREIVLGPRAGDYYLVRHGLAEGELVVTKGNFKLDAELQIQAKPSMMTPEGGGGGGQHGGMNMGKKTPGSKKMKMAPMLPQAVQGQLHALLKVAAKINGSIAAENLPAAREAFGKLQLKVAAVDETGLTGQVKMLWREYAMFLTNDAIEGKDAKDSGTARRVAELMNEHLASMKSKLGLGPDVSPAPIASAIGPKFRQQLAKATSAYLAMQQALGNDHQARASKAATKMAEALDAVDMKLLRGKAHMVWMKTAGQLRKILAGAAGAKDIESLRESFALLSDELAVALGRFGVAGDGLYQFKCPMAFNSRGATWLQVGKEPLNPYFGQAMPQCGDIVQRLPGSRAKGGSNE
jgi:Cu(I)/Ag(I) efflux system membrane fusion protein